MLVLSCDIRMKLIINVYSSTYIFNEINYYLIKDKYLIFSLIEKEFVVKECNFIYLSIYLFKHF